MEVVALQEDRSYCISVCLSLRVLFGLAFLLSWFRRVYTLYMFGVGVSASARRIQNGSADPGYCPRIAILQ